MKKSEYIPSVFRLVEIVNDMTLSTGDKQHLARVKNWLRTKEGAPMSAAKICKLPNCTKYRGISL